jgi:hypothetical protein
MESAPRRLRLVKREPCRLQLSQKSKMRPASYWCDRDVGPHSDALADWCFFIILGGAPIHRQSLSRAMRYQFYAIEYSRLIKSLKAIRPAAFRQ